MGKSRPSSSRCHILETGSWHIKGFQITGISNIWAYIMNRKSSTSLAIWWEGVRVWIRVCAHARVVSWICFVVFCFILIVVSVSSWMYGFMGLIYPDTQLFTLPIHVKRPQNYYRHLSTTNHMDHYGMYFMRISEYESKYASSKMCYVQ